MKLLTDLERNAKRNLEINQKERIETERKVVYQIGQQLDNLA